MESSSPQRRRDRGGDAEVNRGLQLSLRCLGGLCASAVNSIYSHAFLKALIVNNFNLHTLQLNWQKIELFKRNKLLVHNMWLRCVRVILTDQNMKRAIDFRIFCKGNSISINGTMGISAAAARTTSALTPKGKNFTLFTVS